MLHKNADDSVIEYLKEKINKSNIDELIIIQIVIVVYFRKNIDFSYFFFYKLIGKNY